MDSNDARIFRNIEKLETDLWEAADNLRANSTLTSSDYFMPVLRVIFFRHAANRFEAAVRQIGADQAGGKMPKRKILPADFIAGRSAFLSEQARYDWIMDQAAVGGVDLPRPPFTEEESEQVAARVYDYVWEQRNAGQSVFAA